MVGRLRLQPRRSEGGRERYQEPHARDWTRRTGPGPFASRPSHWGLRPGAAAGAETARGTSPVSAAAGRGERAREGRLEAGALWWTWPRPWPSRGLSRPAAAGRPRSLILIRFLLRQGRA